MQRKAHAMEAAILLVKRYEAYAHKRKEGKENRHHLLQIQVATGLDLKSLAIWASKVDTAMMAIANTKERCTSSSSSSCSGLA